MPNARSEIGKLNVVNTKGISSRSNVKRSTSCVATVKSKYSYCQEEHSIYYCKDFLALPVSRRISKIRSRKICVNCLRSSTHSSSKCASGSCKVCQAKHNTLLHATTASPESLANGSSSGENSKSTVSSSVLVTHASSMINDNHIMLSTAVVYATSNYDSKGSHKSCRVLLDCGSQANFISKTFLAKLGLKPRSLNVSISDVNGAITASSQAVQVKLQSRTSSYTANIDCIVTDA